MAAAAGVSYQTVSRVINQSPRVKQSTRQLVLAAISELGFRPNRAARTLAGGAIGSVTVLTPNTTLFGQASLIQGIEEAARAAGFAVGIRVVESDAPQEVADAVDRAVEPGTALIVVAFDRAGTLALAAVPPGVPMVAAVETPVGDEGAGQPWVWTDDRKAAHDATRFLLDLGHQTVHYIAIPSSTEHSQRTEGWRQALREAGVQVPELLQGGWDPHSGYEAGRVLAADPAVTAVLCGNDDLAVGVIRAMHEAGRAIPDSVSVVGFDDTPHAAYLSPALTTVRLDFVELGRECVRRLWSLVDPALATEPQGPRPEPELIVRESAGPAPGQPGSQPVRRRPRSHRSLSGPQSSALSTCHSEGAKRE